MSLSVGILGIGNCGGQIAALGKSKVREISKLEQFWVYL